MIGFALVLALQAPLVETTVGIEGRVFVRTPHELEPRTVENGRVSDDVLLRLVRSEASDDGLRELELAFVIERPGDYDLAPFLALPSGVTPADLEPLPVRVLSLLPSDHLGELEPGARAPLPRYAELRPWLIGGALLWSVPLVVWLVRRAMRPRVRPVLPPTPPTLADQLEPLVAAALEGSLDTQGKARLDRFLLATWRERLGLEDVGHADAVARVRAHPQAGALLVAVERWLHGKSPGAADAQAVRELLEPYRDIAALPPGQLPEPHHAEVVSP